MSSQFSAVDWGIVTLYLGGTLALGLYANRFVRDMADYVVAGRSLRSSIAVASMIGTELGLVTVMYSSQKGFTGGLAAFHIALVAGVVTLVVGMTGFIVVPLRRMGVMTIPEYYERRFGRGVRVFGGAVMALSGILNMGLFLRAGSIFVTEVVGVSSALELKIVMTVLLVLVLVYTSLGGMLSVILTDYVQFVVLSVGLLATCGFAVSALGWQEIVDTVVELKGRAGVDPFDPSIFGWQYVLWMIFVSGLVSCAIWPTAVMRACSVESVAAVKRLYVFSSIGFTIRFLIPYLLGVAAFVYAARDAGFSAHLDAVSVDATERSLRAMPAFLVEILPTGALGLVAAGMLAAFMSTHDSYLLCWSSVLTQDVIAPLWRRPLSTRARLLLTRVLITVIGVFLLIWGLWYPLALDLWDYMAVTGAIYFTGAFAVLVPGIYWRRASRVGAILALCSGFLALLGLGPVQAVLGLEQIDSESVGLATTALAILAMLVGSLLFPDRERPAQGAR